MGWRSLFTPDARAAGCPARETLGTDTCASSRARRGGARPARARRGRNRPRSPRFSSGYLARRLRRHLSFLLPPAPSAAGDCRYRRYRCGRARGAPRSCPPRPGPAPRRRRGAFDGARVTSRPGEAGRAGRGRGRAGEGGSQRWRRLRGSAASTGARRGPAAPGSTGTSSASSGAESAAGSGEWGLSGREVGCRRDGCRATDATGPGSVHPRTGGGATSSSC